MESVQAVLPVILGDLGFFVDDDGTVVSEEAMDQSDGQPVPGRRIVLADLVERVMSG